MITIIILWVLFLSLVWSWVAIDKRAAVLLIPLVAATWWVAKTEVPKYFGYPVPEAQAEFTEALILDYRETSEAIYVFVLEQGQSQPRLLSIPPTEENKKKVETSKDTPMILRKNKLLGAKGGDTEGFGDGGGNLNIVPINKSDMFKKD